MPVGVLAITPAVRYHQAERADSMVIIVSEDGMINLLPNLRRRVARAEVERVVCQIEVAAGDDPDYEVFFRTGKSSACSRST